MNFIITIVLLLCAVIFTTDATTTLSLSTTVKLANVKRLGLNLGGVDSHNMKNLISNPGFEAAEMGTTVLAGNGTSTTTWVHGGGWWDSIGTTNYLTQPTNFWAGGTYEVIVGVNRGSKGTITAQSKGSTYMQGGSAVQYYQYSLSPALPLTSALNDVIVINKQFPSSYPTGSPRPGSPGTQSLLVNSSFPFSRSWDGGYRDSDWTIGKTFIVNGSWQIDFWAMAPIATTLTVSFDRELWNGGVTFDSRTLNVNSTWTHFSYNISVANGVDITDSPYYQGVCCGAGYNQTACTWPSCKRPLLEFVISTSGTAYIDDIVLQRATDTNPTIWTDSAVSRLLDYRPGTLRYWASQLGASLQSQTASPFARRVNDFKPNHNNPSTQGSYSYSLYEFLLLCQNVGADPWYVMPPSFTQQDILNLVDFLAGPTTTTYGAIRSNLGHPTPWTSVFNEIYIEFGNEMWGSGGPNDPFGGASLGYTSEGAGATFRFQQMQNSSNWNSKIKRVLGGQSGYPGSAQSIIAGAKSVFSGTLYNDYYDQAPYFGSLSNAYDTDENKFGPLFALPYQERTNQGSANQTATYLPAGMSLNIYEINHGFTATGPPNGTVRSQWAVGVGGGIVLPLYMLTFMDSIKMRAMNAFSMFGYSYLYQIDAGGAYCCPATNAEFMKIWGMLRDLDRIGTKRPTWLANELVNRAIQNRTNLITVTASGSNPTWSQSAINGIAASIVVPYIQSFAFNGSGGYTLVVWNLHRQVGQTEQITIQVPTGSVPSNTVIIYSLTSGNIYDNNENGAVVTIQTTTKTDFKNAYNYTLPPFSITAFSWQSS